MRVQHFVEAAFLNMLKTKTVGQIHVNALIEEVGICKGTFYKYYCDKYDLLEKCFYNEYYREILEHAETLEEFLEGSLNAFRKTPKIVLHAMTPEDSDSVFGYNSRLVYEHIVHDRVRAGKAAEGAHVERMMKLYAENVTRLTLDWLSAPRLGQTEEEIKLILGAMPVSLSE